EPRVEIAENDDLRVRRGAEALFQDLPEHLRDADPRPGRLARGPMVDEDRERDAADVERRFENAARSRVRIRPRPRRGMNARRLAERIPSEENVVEAVDVVRLEVDERHVPEIGERVA